MIVLGVDPGLKHTGVGLVTSHGRQYELLHFEIHSPKPDLPLSAKLQSIHEFLTGIIREYHPDVLALEDVFYGTNVQSMVRIGEARACAMLAGSQMGVRVVEYMPTRIKESVTGNGRASKEQIQSMVRNLLQLRGSLPPDGADALAAAICHLNSQRHFESKEPVSKKRRWNVSPLNV
ncbi:MAG: crossover junction endodeoxyribonuclease RuvC [Candidatus Omnitrophica bacterium]|nr:crossover junction endodeoxyribonuclease RuvC [Candidatus Omnitrophota bacterium]